MQLGIKEIDIHQMNRNQAKIYIDSQLRAAKKDVYILRIVHGFHGGTKLREMIRKQYKSNVKVIRIEFAMNPGITDLVLRDLF